MKKRRLLAIIFYAMKITIAQLLLIILFTCPAFAKHGSAQAVLTKQITVSAENKQLKKVLGGIYAQTGIQFIYSSKAIRAEQKISVNFSEKTLGDFFEAVLKPLGIGYEITDNQILLFPMDKKVRDSTTVLSLEQLYAAFQKKDRIVAGKVVNEHGEPLRGASVLVVGSLRGTSTDDDGNFKLVLKDDDSVLVFSNTGYESKTYRLVNDNNITVQLVSSVNSLNDVVVIGYGAVKKSDLTGSVVSISKKDIGDRVTGSVASLLAGRAPGIDVTGDQIRVRGVTTLNNTDPLFVIDGFIGGNISSVSANDIESIEVLKDASSTAIYGSRGANGVIIVTTKNGKPGPLKVSVNAFSGQSTVYKKLKVLNAPQYVALVKDMYGNAGKTGDLSAKILSQDVLVDRTNWQDAVERTGINTEANLNFSGGTEKSSYFVSLGYKQAKPIAIGPDNQAYLLRIKNDFKVKKWFRLGDNLGFQFQNNNGAAPWYTLSMITMPPYLTVYDKNNAWGTTNISRTNDLTDYYNPANGSLMTSSQTRALDYQANLYTEIEPMPGLVYRMQVGVNGNFQQHNDFTRDYIDGGVQTNISNVNQTFNYSLYPLLENWVTYTRKIKEHSITALLGNTYQNGAESRSNGVSGAGYNNYSVLNVFNANTQSVSNHGIGQYAYLSYFGRVNYAYRGRYLLTGNFRSDGSPRFSPSHRWGTFPSVAAAWKINDEPFFKRVHGVSQLKMRLTWGITGNDAIGDFQYLSPVQTNTFYPLGPNSTTLVQGATVIKNANSNLKWESTESKDIGIDIAVLNNSLQFTADYFVKKTSDILFQVPQPVSLGYGNNTGAGGNAVVNAASVDNKGFEISALYQHRSDKLSYSFSAFASYITNKVTSLGVGQPYVSGNSRTDVGNPIGYFFGYVVDKVYKTAADVSKDNQAAQAKGFSYYQESTTSAGDLRFKDLDGDGRITSADRTNIGSPIPTFLYGMSANFSYNNFDFNLVIQGVAGNKLFDGDYYSTRGMSKVGNHETYVLNRWESESNPGNGIVPRAILGDAPGNTRPSSVMVENGAYIRLKQASLGYTLPASLIKKMGGIDNLRFYLSSFNLFTITKFTGMDPEIGGNNLTRGIYNIGFPNARQVVLGLQLGL